MAEKIVRGSARHISRSAAVQAVYQMEQNPDDRRDVVRQFLQSRFAKDIKGTVEPDLELFTSITKFLAEDLRIFDGLISECLRDEWKIERLPSITRSVLRCAIYELSYGLTVPTTVVINEYIEVSKGFLDRKDVSFIHSALDNLASKIREQVATTLD